MWARIRLVLPLMQVVMAVFLTTSNYLGPDTVEYPAFTHPDRALCDALTAPAALVRFGLRILAHQLLSLRGLDIAQKLIDTVAFFGSVWLVWYCVSVEIGGKGQSLLTPKTRMRLLADVAAMVLGVGSLVPFLRIGPHLGPTLFGYFILALYLTWATAIVAFYGHDLWVSVKQGERVPD